MTFLVTVGRAMIACNVCTVMYTLVELIFTNGICTANAYSSGQCNTHDKDRNLFVLFLAINLIRNVRLCHNVTHTVI